ncbi:MAG: hypothetical protein WC683_07550 [bacterium]
MMYAWASPDYLLHRCTLVQIFRLYGHGRDFDRLRRGEPVPASSAAPAPVAPDEPDRTALYARYGGIIKQK